MKFAIPVVVAFAALVIACGGGGDEPAPTPDPRACTPVVRTGTVTGIPPLSGETVTTPSGLQYIDEVVGTGPMPTSSAARVSVHYTGWLENGTLFDSSVDRCQPATFQLSGVIRGWTEGVATMRAGGKRRLIIPPDLAYADRGFPPTIPPGATLTFDIQLISTQ